VIVVDASAAMAILFQEHGYQELAAKLERADSCSMSPVSYAEVTMALSRTLRDPKFAADQYIRQTRITICEIDAVQAEWCVLAFMAYGKGRHPARLNLGDCFSYAAAKALNSPLLFVGNDFAQTDIRVA
jgi:ribonuclease VapC